MKTFKQYVLETAKTADRVPVVVPAYTDQYGNTVRAKTVLRKRNKAIVNKGDNPYDGK